MESSELPAIGRRRFLQSTILGSVGLAINGRPVLSAAAQWTDDPPLLAKNGKSTFSICVSEDASPSEKNGAEELQSFLHQMSGAHLPIITDAADIRGDLILVGNSRFLNKLGVEIPFTQLGPEGFVLRTVGRHLVIAGGKQRGTMYGVYTFLERLGCRWFARDVSRIPKTSTLIVLPLNETQRPAFEYRESYFTEALDKNWAARNKMNGSFTELDESTGGKVEYYPFVHTFYELVPPEKYFAEHPEYFALQDGKRRSENAQLCLTNPGTLRVATLKVLAWIKEHPVATIYSVSQNDAEGYCECDNCKHVEQEEGGAHSGPLLRFVNSVAAEVEKEHPEKLIDTLAYWYSAEPPLNVRPRPNVRIRLCLNGACEAHAYDVCERNEYIMKNLRAWSKITNQLYIWHYVQNFSHYLMPFPDFDELAADIPTYREHGVVGLFLEGDCVPGGGGENAELRSYVMARLLWDIRVNVNETVDEFLAGYYGKAAQPMRDYFDLLHRQVRPAPQGKGYHMWMDSEPSDSYLSSEFLTQSLNLFRQAEAAAENEDTRRRVRKAQLPLDFLALTQFKRFEVQRDSYGPIDLDTLNRRYHTFMDNVRSFGMTELHDGSKLEEDDTSFAAIRPYSVVRLENPSCQIAVVPELSGRIVQMIEKRTGKDLLRHPDPADLSYPDLGGLATFAYPDFLAEKPWKMTWALNSTQEPREVALTGSCLNGLKMHRTLRLTDDDVFVHTETVLENSGPSALDVVLESRFEADPGTLERVAVVFRTQDGKAVEKKLIQSVEPSSTRMDPGMQIRKDYTGPDLPDNEWKLVNRTTGLELVNRFPRLQVERSFIKWGARADKGVILGLWSKKKTLAPSEKLRLEADYGLTQRGGVESRAI
jgi:hypothetical protein